MRKNRVRLTESQLHKLIKESVKSFINEGGHLTWKDDDGRMHTNSQDNWYGIEGATFLGAEGIYTYITDNKTEKENSFKIEILFANQKQIQNAVDTIKQKLNQETIAVVKEKVASSLY